MLDAGTIGWALSLKEQCDINSILLSHHHIDHLVGLPFFADTIFGKIPRPVYVYGLEQVLKFVKAHILNDVIWPDFTRLPSASRPTLLCLDVAFSEIQRIEDTDLQFVPLPSCHTGPSCGYLVWNEDTAIVYSGDTGPCSVFWESLKQTCDKNGIKKVDAIILECSFPDRLEDFAFKTGHLTPALLKTELTKWGCEDTHIYIFHMKPQYIEEIEDAILKFKGYNIELMEPDQRIIIK